MKTRVITAVVALAVFIPLLWIGGVPFNVLVFAMGIVGMSEFLVMKKELIVSVEALLSFIGISALLAPEMWHSFLPGHVTTLDAFYFTMLLLLVYTVFSRNRISFDDAGVTALGGLYAGMGFHLMMTARAQSFWVILYALLIVWITDSGAYLIGRKLGRHKLAPHVSPNKTWEGSIGGSVVSVIVAGLYLAFAPVSFSYSLPVMLLLSLLFSVGGQIGDLIESAFKRHYGVKDSGRILPGHGGILDRFDSLLFVLPLMHLFGLI